MPAPPRAARRLPAPIRDSDDLQILARRQAGNDDREGPQRIDGKEANGGNGRGGEDHAADETHHYRNHSRFPSG